MLTLSEGRSSLKPSFQHLPMSVHKGKIIGHGDYINSPYAICSCTMRKYCDAAKSYNFVHHDNDYQTMMTRKLVLVASRLCEGLMQEPTDHFRMCNAANCSLRQPVQSYQPDLQKLLLPCCPCVMINESCSSYMFAAHIGIHRRNADTLKKLQETEKLLKERTEAAYVNLDVSNEEREKGNQVGHVCQPVA